MRIPIRWVSAIGLVALGLLCCKSVETQRHHSTDSQPPDSKHDTPAAARRPLAIRNFLQLTPDIGTSGQPSEEDLQQLKQLGYRTVLNLRRPEEGIQEEGEKVEAAGMRYIHIPIDGYNLQENQITHFSEAVTDTGNYPLLIHCGSGNRVGGLLFLHRVLQENRDQQTALEEARRIGLRKWFEDVVVERIRQHNTQMDDRDPTPTDSTRSAP